MDYQPQDDSFSTPEFKTCQWVTYNAYADYGEPLWVPCNRRVLYRGLCGEHIKAWLEADKVKNLKNRFFGKPQPPQHRRNPDEEIRRLERELSASPEDTDLQGWLIAHYTRNGWPWVLCGSCGHLYSHQEARLCWQCHYWGTENAERYLCNNCATPCNHCNTPNALEEHIYGCSDHNGICAGCNQPVHDFTDCSSRCSRCDRQACDACRVSVEEEEIFGVSSFTVCPPCHEETLQQIEQYSQFRQQAIELHGNYTCDELDDMPSVGSGHFSNTLLLDGNIRVLRGRMTIADGAMFDHAVEIEILNQLRGQWETVAEYDCRNPEDIYIYDNE
jgi:hypothetical protein